MSVSEELADLVRGLVDQPESVEIEEVDRGHEVCFRLQVAPEDLGKVIGRQGRTVRALRSLLEARTGSGETRYELEILEP